MNIPPTHNDSAPGDFALPSHDQTARWYSGRTSDGDNASPPDPTWFSPPMFPGFELEGQRGPRLREEMSYQAHVTGTRAGDASTLSGAGTMQLAPTRDSPFYGQIDHPEYTANASYVDEAEAVNGMQDLDDFLALLASGDQSIMNNAPGPSSRMTPETSTGVGQNIASHAQRYHTPTEGTPAGTYPDDQRAYAASSIPSFGVPMSNGGFHVGPSVKDTIPFSAYLQNYQRPAGLAVPNSYQGILNIPAYSGTVPPLMPAGAGGASRPMHASNHPVNIQGPYGGWRERATVAAGTYTPPHVPRLDWNPANFDATSPVNAPFSVTSTAPLGNREMNEARQALGPRVPASTRQSVGVQRTRRARPAQSSAPYPIPVRNDGCDAQVGDPGPSTVAHASASYAMGVPQAADASAKDFEQAAQRNDNIVSSEQSHPASTASQKLQVPPADKTWIFDKATRKLRVYTGAPLSTPARPGARYPVCHPRPMGLDQYCAQCWDAGKKVVWMDDERRKKHDLREHSLHGHPPRGVNPKHKRR